MTSFDIPAASRIVIGFDRFLKVLEKATSEAASNVGGYPPYNIERVGDDLYRITLALAGFTRSDVDINVTDGVLVIKGEQKDEAADGEVLYRGIATRAFERTFKLADYVEVKSASFDNGLLRIELAREVPEAKKPRKIDIEAA
jgi:molecular chaperone IbpA